MIENGKFEGKILSYFVLPWKTLWKLETFSVALLLVKTCFPTTPEGFIIVAGSNVENPVENVENNVKTLIFCEKPYFPKGELPYDNS